MHFRCSRPPSLWHFVTAGSPMTLIQRLLVKDNGHVAMAGDHLFLRYGAMSWRTCPDSLPDGHICTSTWGGGEDKRSVWKTSGHTTPFQGKVKLRVWQMRAHSNHGEHNSPPPNYVSMRKDIRNSEPPFYQQTFGLQSDCQ